MTAPGAIAIAFLGGLALIIAALGWGATSGPPHEDALFVLAFAAVLWVALHLVATAGLLARLRRRVLPGARTAAVLFAVAAVSAIPVDHAWCDGCNSHEATVPLVTLPWVVLESPETPLAYRNRQTLMEC